MLLGWRATIWKLEHLTHVLRQDEAVTKILAFLMCKHLEWGFWVNKYPQKALQSFWTKSKTGTNVLKKRYGSSRKKWKTFLISVTVLLGKSEKVKNVLNKHQSLIRPFYVNALLPIYWTHGHSIRYIIVVKKRYGWTWNNQDLEELGGKVIKALPLTIQRGRWPL